MSCYVTGMFEELEKECSAAMLHGNMDLSRLMVYAQQVEKSRLRKYYIEAKKARSFESGYSMNRLDIRDKYNFKKRYSKQVTSNFSNTLN